MTTEKLVNRINIAINRLDEKTKFFVNEGIRRKELPTVRQFVESIIAEGIERNIELNEIDVIMDIMEDLTHYANNQIEYSV